MNPGPEVSVDPPGAWAPPEVETWFADALQGVSVARMDAFRNPSGELENVELHVHLGEDVRLGPNKTLLDEISRLGGRPSMGPHFRLPALAHVALTALGHGRFRGIKRVAADGEELFRNNGRFTDARTATGLLVEASHRATRCEAVDLEAVDDDFEDCVAQVRLRRNPKKQTVGLELRFHGRVQEADFASALVSFRRQLADQQASA